MAKEKPVTAIPAVNPAEWPSIPQQALTETPAIEAAIAARMTQSTDVPPSPNVSHIPAHTFLQQLLDRYQISIEVSPPNLLAVSDGSYILQKPVITVRYTHADR